MVKGSGDEWHAVRYEEHIRCVETESNHVKYKVTETSRQATYVGKVLGPHAQALEDLPSAQRAPRGSGKPLPALTWGEAVSSAQSAASNKVTDYQCQVSDKGNTTTSVSRRVWDADTRTGFAKEERYCTQPYYAPRGVGGRRSRKY